jgi:trehalose 6-phosphate phosphatase
MLARLAGRYGLVAVVTGRTAAEARRILGPELAAVRVFGLYGLEGAEMAENAERAEGPASPVAWIREQVGAISAQVPGSRVEDKGASLAVHYREAAAPEAAARALAEALEPLALANGLRLLPGKMVLELAPAAMPGKGRVVAQACRAHGLRGCLYAGDDVADLDAFRQLCELRGEGLIVVLVAVVSEETPAGLREAADVVVDRPAGLVAFLSATLL